MALNAKQKIFVKEYLVDKNATRAAKAAGYSKSSAQQIGAENLLKPVIRDAIARGIESQSKRLDITADKVIQEIGGIAFADITKFRRKTARIKTSDKVKSLEILAKHFKLMTDLVETTGVDGGPIVILTMPANGSEAPKPKKKTEE